MTKREIIEDFTAGMNKLYEWINYKEYTGEKTIYYSDLLKSVFQRFILESEKKNCDIFDLIRMADIMTKIWSAKEENEMEGFIAYLGREIDKGIEYIDSTNDVKAESDVDITKLRDCATDSWNKLKQLTEAHTIIEVIRSFPMLVSRMYCVLLEIMAESRADDLEKSTNIASGLSSKMDLSEKNRKVEDDELETDNTVNSEEIFKRYAYGQFNFLVPIPHELFERVEEWFGEQKELDEIMGRA